jgi:hypothetical protein
LSFVLCAVVIHCVVASAMAQTRGGAAPADLGGTAVLDTHGFWRLHHTLRPPMLQGSGAPQPALLPQPWLNLETTPPPADWKDPNFDDSGWVRQTAPTVCRTPYLARLCMRGKFAVTDPSRVKGLMLKLVYAGGAAVYLNGKEVCVDHASAGKGGEMEYSDKAAAANLAAGVAVPTNLLRRGVNVLAIEVVRPPFAEAVAGGKDPSYKLSSDTCAVNQVQFVAPSADGLAPNVARPAGMQAWNSSVLTPDCDGDWGDATEPLRPVAMVGARGGVYSGKVVVGSTKKLAGLKATSADLKSSDGATIPASAVTIRYALPWGVDPTLSPRGVMTYPGRISLLSALSEVAPASLDVGKPDTNAKARPPVAGAVVPVWITVNVPRDAKGGTYVGPVRIEAAGEQPIVAQISLKVVGWTVPAPQDYKTWVETIESPDTLSLEYATPLWSDKHFEMIARSFDQCNQIGSRTLYVPLVAHTNLGNAETMVRFIKKGENKYDFDFTAMEKYLDLALKHMGTPKIVVLQVWEIYMSSKESAGKRFGEGMASSGAKFLDCPQVTVLDPASGKTENVSMPKLTDPASKAIWQGLITQVRDRMKKRGLDKALMYGMFTDAGPTKEDVQFFNGLAPDLPWVMQGHGLFEVGQKCQGIAQLGYQASVWGAKFCDSVPTHGTTDNNDLHGWQNKLLMADFERNTELDSYPGARWRQFAEQCITGNSRGPGRVGLDYWKAIKDKSGAKRVDFVHARYPEGAWGIGGIWLNLANPVLAPAPQGPVATQRFELFREGIQECEAHVYIDGALLDPASRAKLGADLAKRCEDAFAERKPILWRSLSNLQLIGPAWGDARLWRWTEDVAGHVWYAGSLWQERSEKLYSLAAEVATKIGK